MLKLHDFQCTSCETIREELIDGDPQTTSLHCTCGAPMKNILFGGKAHVFKPFIHPHLDHHPVEIRSWSQYRSELSKRNLANPMAT